MASINTNDDRFWSKVKKVGRTECWLWQGAKKPSGYGNIRRNKKYTTAHRLAWELSFGSIPKGMQIQHSCDTASCCNPNHLMLGTVISNYVDMCKKGRNKSNHTNRKFGVANHNSKLSEEQVSEIRKRYVPGQIRQRDLADDYGVSQRLISIITRNEGRIHG